MELIKDIYFNTDKLVENTKVKVSYTGKFYQGNNEKVFIHYGYGENWNNVNEVEMKKTDLGYQTEINLLGSDTLNFCFKNQNNEWDNNCGKNYVFNIEKATVNNFGKTTVGIKKENNTLFGKAFGKTNDNSSVEKNIGNIFWNSSKVENKNEFNNVKPQTSGVTENTIPVGIPTSIDTFINKNQCGINSNDNGNIKTTCKIGSEIQSNTKPNEIPFSNKGNVDVFGNSVVNNIHTNSNINNINEFNKNGINNIGINAKISTPNGVSEINATTVQNPGNNVNTNTATKFIPVNNTQQQSTALAVVNTGFQKTIIWTKKIKTSVCKFFSYVPKLISGNYKRKVENKQQK